MCCVRHSAEGSGAAALLALHQLLSSSRWSPAAGSSTTRQPRTPNQSARELCSYASRCSTGCLLIAELARMTRAASSVRAACLSPPRSTHKSGCGQRGSRRTRRCSSGCDSCGARNDGTECASCCGAYPACSKRSTAGVSEGPGRREHSTSSSQSPALTKEPVPLPFFPIAAVFKDGQGGRPRKGESGPR
jgi:hypothetical protein